MGQVHEIAAEEYVIDASAAFEYLLNAPKGQRIAELIQDLPPIAPETLDAEVLSALRSGVMWGEIDESQAPLRQRDCRASLAMTRSPQP